MCCRISSRSETKGEDVACSIPQSRVNSAADAALDGVLQLRCNRRQEARPPRARGFPPLLILVWWCCVCSVWLLLALVRSLIMTGWPPIWIGCLLVGCLPSRLCAVAVRLAPMLWPSAMRGSAGLLCVCSRLLGALSVAPLARSATSSWRSMAMRWLLIGMGAPLVRRPWCAAPLLVGCALSCAASDGADRSKRETPEKNDLAESSVPGFLMVGR